MLCRSCVMFEFARMRASCLNLSAPALQLRKSRVELESGLTLQSQHLSEVLPTITVIKSICIFFDTVMVQDYYLRLLLHVAITTGGSRLVEQCGDKLTWS